MYYIHVVWTKYETLDHRVDNIPKSMHLTKQHWVEYRTKCPDRLPIAQI